MPGRLALQNRQAANHRFVDGVRALASAEDEQCRRAAALGRDLEKRLPHRNARDFGMAKIFRRLLEMHRRARHKSRDHAIGKSRHHVRLKGQRRNVLDHRRQHRRAGGISAHADHHVGREFVEHAARIPDGARQDRRRSSAAWSG